MKFVTNKDSQNSINIINKNIKVYYIIQILMVIAITIPHAILTIILLNKGILINQIAIIQFFYNLAMLIFELPSGVISDKVSRKRTFMISTVFLFMGFFLILKFDSFYILCIGWFSYGLSQALSTGTLDSDIINNIKEYKKDYYKTFFRRSNYIGLIGSILGSGVGFFLYRMIDINIYIISLILICFAFIIASLFYKSLDNEKIKVSRVSDFKEHLFSSLKEVRTNKITKYAILSLIILQVYLQFHFHYWQAIFLDIGIKEDYFYLSYLIFQLVNIFVYRIDLEDFQKSKLYIVFFISLLSIALQLISYNNLLYIIFYLVVLFFFMLISYLSNYLLNKYVSKERISSIVSFNSTLQRLVASMSLLSFSFILKFLSLRMTLIVISLIVIIAELFLTSRLVSLRKKAA